MISDLTIFATLIVTSLMMVIMAHSHQKIRLFLKNETAVQGEQAAKNLNRIQIYLHVIYFFLIIGIGVRLVLFFIFPAEYSGIWQDVPLQSLPFVMIVTQFLFFSVYTFLFFSLYISQNLIPQKRHQFLLKVLKIGLFIAFTDIVISFITYLKLSLRSILPEIYTTTGWNMYLPDEWIFRVAAILAVTLLILFVFAFLIRRKSNNKMIRLFYNSVFFCAFIVDIILFLYSVALASGQKAGISLFTSENGYAAQVWLLFIGITLGANELASVIRKLDTDFINSNYGTNLALQLHTVTFTGLTALSILSVWVPFLLLLY